MGVPPAIIHFQTGIFSINQPFGGSPMAMETPTSLSSTTYSWCVLQVDPLPVFFHCISRANTGPTPNKNQRLGKFGSAMAPKHVSDLDKAVENGFHTAKPLICGGKRCALRFHIVYLGFRLVLHSSCLVYRSDMRATSTTSGNAMINLDSGCITTER